MGPLPSGHLLCCVVYYFFRFLELIVIKEISADKIKEVLTAVINVTFSLEHWYLIMGLALR